MHKTLSLILILFLNFGALSANTDNITSESDMNVFNSGETISSSKMNENFEILKLSKTELVEEVNKLNDNITNLNQKIEELKNQLSSLVQLNNLDNQENQLIAVGEKGQILSSHNGVSWKIKNVFSDFNFVDIAEGNGTYVILGNNLNGTSSKIFVSNDLHSWRAISLQNDGRYNSIAFGNNLFVLVGHNGYIFTSVDGTSWTYQETPRPYEIQKIAYGNNIFITAGKGDGTGAYMKSNDGTNWEVMNFPETNLEPYSIKYINYDTYFYVAGQDKMLYRTQDSISWEYASINSNENYHHIYDIANVDNNYALVTRYGVYQSNNATSWSKINDSPLIRNIINLNGLYVGIDLDGKIYNSTNITSWEEIPSNTTNGINAIIKTNM